MNSLLLLAASVAVFAQDGTKVCDVTLPELPEGATIESKTLDGGMAWRICYDTNIVMRVADEKWNFTFARDYRCWPVSHAQGEYAPYTLSTIDKMQPMPRTALVAAGIGEMLNYERELPGTAESPLVIEGDGWVAALGDAGVLDWARTRFQSGENANEIKTVLEGEAVTDRTEVSPWRYIHIAKDCTSLAQTQPQILDELCEKSRIADTSWIKPGKVLRVAKLDEPTGKAAVDFAKRNNLQYIELDAGWYGQEHTGNPLEPKPYVLPIINYAKEQGIGVILYVNREPLKIARDKILDAIASWGVKGVKYGFVNVGDQKWRRWVVDAIQAAADRKLLVDIHDEFRLTGIERTFPNVMTVEGIRGNEEMPAAPHDAALVYTRFLDGPGDYTPCWTISRVKNTLAHQLAMPCVYTSGFQFLFWYQRPDQIKEADPALDFWREIPCSFDETRHLQGRIGEYAVVARRVGDKWFVGGLNGAMRRTFSIPLDFLGVGDWEARIFEDADPTIKEGLGKVAIREEKVSSSTTLEIDAASRGGFAVIIERPIDIEKVFARAKSQYKILLDKFNATKNEFPRSWTRGKYKTEPDIGWTTGFFPGSLWYIYADSKDPFWRDAAVDWTRRLQGAKTYRENHDLGFMFFCSYGNAIKYAPDAIPEAKDVILTASKTLYTRWDEKLGLIRSWDKPRFMQFPVIIDSMMNLEMMEWSAKNCAEPELDRISRLHADKLLKTHYRPNGTVYHVTDWNPRTGRIYARYAWQGACVEGAWARGQAWSVYGYTVMFRETREERYLEQARKSADWIIAHAPADAIPYWDYIEATTPGAPRDASAAAVTASALINLDSYIPGRGYRSFAKRILRSLASDEYLAKEGECGGFLLKHSTGHLPEDTEIDASINYADYYFLEALLRLKD